MPRNGSGVYSKPAGTTVTPNTTISSSTFNAVVDDFVSDANAIRPVSAGGTGAANIEAAADALGAMRKAVYDPDGNGVVDRAAQADSVPWSGVADKPASYPPAGHSHGVASINDASDAGRALLTAADAAAQRTALGLSPGTIIYVFDGGGSALTAGMRGDIIVPFACTIKEWSLLADQSGSAVIDIWKTTFTNFPPTVANTIASGAKPTLSAAAKSQSALLTGWTTMVSSGDILRFNVDSAATVTRVTLALKVERV